jgi:hypothetical protein
VTGELTLLTDDLRLEPFSLRPDFFPLLGIQCNRGGGSLSKGKVCKETDRGMKISEIMLLKKSGGKWDLYSTGRVTQGERRPPENNSGKVDLLQSGVVERCAGSPR